MKRLLTMYAAVGASLFATSYALGADFGAWDGSSVYEQTRIPGRMTAYFADEEKEAKKEDKAAPANCGSESKSSCGSEAKSSCGSETPACGSEASSSESSCGCDDHWCELGLENHWPFCCCCKPGDPCTLEKHLTPCCKDVTYGGFIDV